MWFVMWSWKIGWVGEEAGGGAGEESAVVKRGANWDAVAGEEPLKRAGVVPKTKGGVVPARGAEEEEREPGDVVELVAAAEGEEERSSGAMRKP